jgi:tetratricopeptide (TPR) repeat protein
MTRWLLGRSGPLLVLGSLLATPVAAQAIQDAVTRALELERRGDHAGAAAAYQGALERRPADLGALLGLERTLTELARARDVVPFARAALDGSSDSSAVFAMLVRGFVAAGESDSASGAAERWAATLPGEEAPYRELGAALAAQRDRSGARRAFLLGRERVGRPSALAPELAQLAIMEGDFTGSVREWLLAIEEVPGYRLSAMSGLGAAPDRERAAILAQVEQARTAAARQLEAALRARWGDPVRGFEVLNASLGADRARAAEALREYLEQVRPQRTPAGRRAMGMTLEALAERLPEAQARRLRSEAAQAYADAGDRESARRVLGRLADDRESPGALAAGAGTTLIEVLVDEGKVEEAEERLVTLADQIPSEDHLALRRRVAQGHALQGRLDRADSLIASDRSVEGMALAGRIALYRGDLKTAREMMRAAGPFAGDREAATARAAVLALLQPIEADSLPPLGAAFLALDRADTTAATTGLEEVAATLDGAKGGAELRVLAGRLAAAGSRHADAERLFRAAAAEQGGATAPAAGLELGRLLLTLGRRDEAIATLEHVILTWPRSALVPQARRLLDEARGAIPRT